MINIVIHSVQKWLPFEKILDNGIIKLKNNCYVMIMKVKPINYNLKSNFEKEAILNSYKIFLKTCNFDIQIIIQTQILAYRTKRVGDTLVPITRVFT